MFKIRTPQFNDFVKLEHLFKDNALFIHLNKNRVLCTLQNFIPHNFRTLPSIHLAVEEENVLGFVILQCNSKPNNCWQINEVFVLDEIRNKGIGEELLRYVLSVYGGYGIEHFLAAVDSQNFPALSLFHQCGFRRYAKVCFYEKEINIEKIREMSVLEKDFIIRAQTNTDLNELEKLDLSSIPPDLRPALGRSKEYFKQKKNAVVLIDKSRNLLIGWAQIEKISDDNCFIEPLMAPGWTHLYEQFLNTIIADFTGGNSNLKITVKAIDYITELSDILNKSGYLQTNIKELLVRTVWQRVKERKLKRAKIGAPFTAPT